MPLARTRHFHIMGYLSDLWGYKSYARGSHSVDHGAGFRFWAEAIFRERVRARLQATTHCEAGNKSP
jgi:hypothetical protein